MGTAPEANLIGVKVLDSRGSGSLSDVIKGLQWAVDNKDRYDIRVVNMSLGAPASGTSHSDLLCEAVEKVVEAGLVTVVAAGNSGPGRHSVTTPGIDPKVITVGALDDAGTIQRVDDSIAEFSGRGPTKVDRFVKPDLVTPGVKLVATSAPGSTLDGDPNVPHVDGGYIVLSGTSMATPVTSGIVACLLSARPNMTPLQLKHVLKSSAEQLEHVPPYTRNDQGAGVVDAAAALALARAHEGAGQ